MPKISKTDPKPTAAEVPATAPEEQETPPETPEEPTPTETTPEPSESTETAPEPEKKPVGRKTGRRPAPAASKTGALFAPLSAEREFARAVFWGREGSGKTTSAMHAAHLGRILVINAEGGIKKKPLIDMGVPVDNIMVWPPRGEQITHKGLDEVYFQIKSDLQDDPDSWMAVVLDSASEVVIGMVDHVSTDRVEKARANNRTIDEVDAFFTDRSDYGTMSKMFRDILRKFRDLPCHLIITGLERRDVDEDSAKVTYGPAVPPAIQTDLLGQVDFVLHFRAADDEGKPFRAVTKKSGKYRTKDREGVLPHVLAHPTFDRIVGYINGDLQEEADKEQKALVAAAPAKKPAATRTRASRAKGSSEAESASADKG